MGFQPQTVKALEPEGLLGGGGGGQPFSMQCKLNTEEMYMFTDKLTPCQRTEKCLCMHLNATGCLRVN